MTEFLIRLFVAIGISWALVSGVLAVVPRILGASGRRSGAYRLQTRTFGLLAIGMLFLPLALRAVPSFIDIPVGGSVGAFLAEWGAVEADPFASIGVVLMALYGMGVVSLLLRVIVGLFLGTRLVDDGEDRTVAASERAGLPIDAGVRVIATPRVRGPGCFGLRRSVILLPSSWARWSPDTLRVVLTHELAHARSRDPLGRASLAVVRALYWPHPVLWWMGRQLRRCSEFAADREGLRAAGSVAEYRRVFEEIFSSTSGHRRSLDTVVAMGDEAFSKARWRRLGSEGGEPFRELRGPAVPVASMAIVVLAVWTATGVRIALEGGRDRVSRIGIVAPEVPVLHGDRVGTWSSGDVRTSASWTDATFLVPATFEEGDLGSVAAGGGRIEIVEQGPVGTTRVHLEGDGAGRFRVTEFAGYAASLGPDERRHVIRRMVEGLVRETTLVDAAVERGRVSPQEILRIPGSVDVESPSIRGRRVATLLLEGISLPRPIHEMLYDDLSRRSFIEEIVEASGRPDIREEGRAVPLASWTTVLEQVAVSFERPSALRRTLTRLHEGSRSPGMRHALLGLAETSLTDPTERRLHLSSVARYFASDPALSERFAQSLDVLPSVERQLLRTRLATMDY